MLRQSARIFAWIAAVIGTFGAVVAVGYVVVRHVPGWADESEGLGPINSALERGRVRTAALVYVGGVVAAAGAVFTGLTFRLSRRGQAADRFNNAVELIGDDKLDLRVGGVHALAQLALDDPGRHHAAVVDVLLIFVRERSPWPPPAPQPPSVPHAPADVKAAIAALARRKHAYDPPRLHIDLSGTNLRGVSAPSIRLGNALLNHTQLQDAILTGAHLKGAVFTDANLDDANLAKAILDADTSFEGASLLRTSLRRVRGLSEASFKEATYDPAATDWGGKPAPGGTTPI